MGSRPSSFKKGGGYLNGVDVTLTGYQFTDEFNGEPFEAGKVKGKEKFHALYCVPSFRVDGADEDTTTTLFTGGYDDFEISADGLTLTNPNGGECTLGANTATAKFFKSAVDKGFPEERLSDDPGSVCFAPVIGSRFRLVQAPLSPEEAADLKRRGKSLVRKSKDGKEYPITTLLIDEVYEVPSLKGAKVATGKPTPTNGKAAKAAPKDEEEVDIASLAADKVKEYLSDAKDTTLPKSKLRMKVLTDADFKGKSDVRDEVVKWIFDDDNLEAIDGVSYSRKDKSQAVSLEQ